MRKRISRFKAKAFPAFRPSGDGVLSGDPEPAVEEASGSTPVTPAHASTTQEPVAPIPNTHTSATEGSAARSVAAQDPIPQAPAPQAPIVQAQSVPEPRPPQPWDMSIRKLWDVAYEDLRQGNPDLIDKYEGLILKDMRAAFATMLPAGPFKREQMQFVLQRKMDDVKRNAWKLKFGSWTEIEVKEIVAPVLGVVNWANKYITDAVGGSPQASIAWAGVSLILPLLLNPAEQASSLAKALEYISNLIVQGRMREDLFIRSCESGTRDAGPQGDSAFKVQPDPSQPDTPFLPTFLARPFIFPQPDPSYLPNQTLPDQTPSYLAIFLPSYLPRQTLPIFLEALKELYLRILTLQAEAYCYFAGSTPRLARDIVKWDDWEALLAAVKAGENSFLKINEVWKDAKYDDECMATQKRYEETRRDLQAIGADLTGLRQAIGEARQDKKRSKLLAWLCNVDHSVTFNNNRNRHEEGTSEWLLKDCGEFTEWQKLPASFLWLHGKAGSGKSVLSSSVINHLRTTHKTDPEKALAYFYFSFTDTQSTDTMISSLIKQLCARRPTIAPSVDAFHEYMDRGDRPDTAMLEESLLDTTCGFSTVYIILDGLDECTTVNDQRRQLLRSLCRLLCKLPDNAHVFCTSRKEPDILAELRPLLIAPNWNDLDLTHGAHRWSLDRDIRLYIVSTLQSTAYSSWSQDLKHEAQDALIEKADGMFQYVFLQLQELRKPGVLSPFRIRQKLKALPQGLDETYDRVLQNIDESVRPEVRAMLMWLAFGSARDKQFDVTLESLAQVLLFRPNRDGVADDDEQLFQAEDILKLMPGLVTTHVAVRWLDEEEQDERRLLQRRDISRAPSPICRSEKEDDKLKVEDNDINHVQSQEAHSHSRRSGRKKLDKPPRYVHVRIAHFSVQEYLMSDRIRQAPAKSFAFSETEAHVYIAQTWLAYHLYSCSANQPQRLRINLQRRNLDVCSQWAYHMEAVPREDWPQELEDAALRALAPRSKGFIYFRQSFTYADLSLNLNGFEGLGNVHFTSQVLSRPHCCAAFGGWFKLTQLLLSGTSGANRYLTQRDFDVVLFNAAYNGHVDIVRLALKMGANIHSRHIRRRRHFFRTYGDRIFQTVLHTASENGHLTTVEFLLAQGADINARDSRGQSVLHTLVREKGCDSKIISYFLDRGADVNALDFIGCSVLMAAMSSYDRQIEFSPPFDSKAWLETIRLLVDRGADPRNCSSALGAPFGDGLEATRYLLDKGADVNQSDIFGQTALHKVVTNGEENTFRLLLERGADVNAVTHRSAVSVLQAACYSPHGIIYLADLLKEGADPAAPPGDWGSAIHMSCVYGLHRHGDNYFAIVQMLLDAGADVNAEGGDYGFPLQAAVASCGSDGHLGRDVVELLLESGADVNAQGGEYGSALQAACQVNNPDLVRHLLGRGADPNVAGGKFGNPLAAVVGERRDRNSNLSRERHFANVMEIVGLLLDAGARVDAKGNRRYGTALHAAARNESADVVRLLLKRGANVNGSNGELYGSALQAACAEFEGDPSIPRLLLEHGADVLARGGEYGTAFHAAVATENISEENLINPKTSWSKDTIELLLASEPRLEVNDTGGPGGTTAIHLLMGDQRIQGWADEKEYEAILLSIRQRLQLLIEHGVDVNLGGGTKHGSPLQAACAVDSEVSLGRAEMLLDLFPTIEVNCTGGLLGSPLQEAAYSGQTETVRMLLKRNADVHARGGRYGSALNAAIIREQWDIFEILRGAGAKTDCEILKIPDQLWLWQMEREVHVYRFGKHYEYIQHGEDAVARYEKVWEVETGKEVPVDRVLEWLFG